MPLLPVRQLGSAGVLTDLDPFNLPFNGFTRAKNVRFTQEGNVERSPIFRDISGALTLDGNPSHITGVFGGSAGYDTLTVVTDLYHVYTFSNGTLTSNVDFAASASAVPFTTTTLADVQYINRPDRVPVFLAPSGSTFANLTNWDANHRCNSLRSYGDFLVALNMTESGTEYPNRVRFSDIALANSVPSSWDATDATKSAGFNDLVQMNTPIVDGETLGTNFVIYSSDQVYNMEFVGGTFIFNFRKLFDDCGVINQNCVVEVEGRHYVFDNDDIYVHDGNTRQSISDQRVRDYIFSGLDSSKTEACFVHHNALLEEIYFCYHTGDDMVTMPDASHCNRAAVYNYRANTWSFVDLPNVVSGTTANVNTVATYATATTTYATTGGSYHDQESNYARHNVFFSKSLSGSLSSDKLLAMDGATVGAIQAPIDTSATQSIFLERVGIDLDQEAGSPLSGYKVLKAFYPQITTSDSDSEVTFTFGSADLPSGIPSYGTAVTYDMSTDHKVDTRASGRYLSYKLTDDTSNKDFKFSGMDVDVVVTGRR